MKLQRLAYSVYRFANLKSIGNCTEFVPYTFGGFEFSAYVPESHYLIFTRTKMLFSCCFRRAVHNRHKPASRKAKLVIYQAFNVRLEAGGFYIKYQPPSH